jgi:hypothetical protein
MQAFLSTPTPMAREFYANPKNQSADDVRPQPTCVPPWRVVAPSSKLDVVAPSQNPDVVAPSSSEPDVVAPSSSKPRPSQKRDLDDYKYLPLRKVDPDMFRYGALPKMQPKPADSPKFKRACKSRTAEDRHATRQEDADTYEDVFTHDLPWDVRGPLNGPAGGGPQFYKGQKFREGSQRWANPGGMFREMYAKYHSMKKQGCIGKELQYYHPMDTNGFWAKAAWAQNQLAPFEMKKIAVEMKSIAVTAE